MTMKQIEQSLAMFRKTCVEKLKIDGGEYYLYLLNSH